MSGDDIYGSSSMGCIRDSDMYSLLINHTLDMAIRNTFLGFSNTCLKIHFSYKNQFFAPNTARHLGCNLEILYHNHCKKKYHIIAMTLVSIKKICRVRQNLPYLPKATNATGNNTLIFNGLFTLILVLSIAWIVLPCSWEIIIFYLWRGLIVLGYLIIAG